MSKNYSPAQKNKPNKINSLKLSLFSCKALFAATVIADQPPENLVDIGTTHFPPYFIDTTVNRANDSYPPNANGFLYDAIESLLTSKGYQVRFRFLPLARAENFVLTGTINCLSPVRDRESHDSSLIFSSPLPGGPVVLLGRSGTGDRISSLEQIQHFHIGALIGDHSADSILSNQVLARMDKARTHSQNIQKLIFKRIDYALIDYAVALNTITDEFPDYADKIEPVYPPLTYQSIYLACNGGKTENAEILADFNAALKLALKNQALNQIAERYGLDDLFIINSQAEVLR